MHPWMGAHIRETGHRWRIDSIGGKETREKVIIVREWRRLIGEVSSGEEAGAFSRAVEVN